MSAFLMMCLCNKRHIDQRLSRDIPDLPQLCFLQLVNFLRLLFCLLAVIPVRLDCLLGAFTTLAKFHETKSTIRFSDLLDSEEVTVQILENTARVGHVFTEESAKHAIGQVVVRLDI